MVTVVENRARNGDNDTIHIRYIPGSNVPHPPAAQLTLSLLSSGLVVPPQCGCWRATAAGCLTSVQPAPCLSLTPPSNQASKPTLRLLAPWSRHKPQAAIRTFLFCARCSNPLPRSGVPRSVGACPCGACDASCLFCCASASSSSLLRINSVCEQVMEVHSGLGFGSTDLHDCHRQRRPRQLASRLPAAWLRLERAL